MFKRFFRVKPSWAMIALLFSMSAPRIGYGEISTFTVQTPSTKTSHMLQRGVAFRQRTALTGAILKHRWHNVERRVAQQVFKTCSKKLLGFLTSADVDYWAQVKYKPSSARIEKLGIEEFARRTLFLYRTPNLDQDPGPPNLTWNQALTQPGNTFGQFLGAVKSEINRTGLLVKHKERATQIRELDMFRDKLAQVAIDYKNQRYDFPRHRLDKRLPLTIKSKFIQLYLWSHNVLLKQIKAAPAGATPASFGM